MLLHPQLAETLLDADCATLAFDATTLKGTHVNTIYFSTPDGILSASVQEVLGARAEDYLAHITDVIDEIATAYALFSKRDIDSVISDIAAVIKSTLTDRVSTNHATIVLLEAMLNEKLLELNCNVHPLDSISSVCREALKT